MKTFTDFIQGDFKESLFEELEQLQGWINKLDTFIRGSKFSELEIERQDLLKDQLYVMNQYENFLTLRIELLDT